MTVRRKSIELPPRETFELLHLHAPSGRQMTEWRDDTTPGWRVINGPAKEALDLVEDASVDCVITSPPYFWLRDYKVNGQIGLEESVDGYVVAIRAVDGKGSSQTQARRRALPKPW